METYQNFTDWLITLLYKTEAYEPGRSVKDQPWCQAVIATRSIWRLFRQKSDKSRRLGLIKQSMQFSNIAMGVIRDAGIKSANGFRVFPTALF